MRWTYAGVRPLSDDESANASKVTRDYKLELAEGSRRAGAPVGFRRQDHDLPQAGGDGAAETATRSSADRTRAGPTEAPLPGGDLPRDDFAAFLQGVQRRWPFLPDSLARRLAHAYGTRISDIIGAARGMEDLGEQFRSRPDLGRAGISSHP